MRNTSLLVSPAEPVIENDLPLDLSCNSRRGGRDDDEPAADEPLAMDKAPRPASIGGPPSPPRSPADLGALAELGYVAYHRHLMALERQRQWQRRKRAHDDDDDSDDERPVRRPSGSPSPRSTASGHDDSAPDDDSDDSPMDLGANPKAYKKSLMKRYRKSPGVRNRDKRGPRQSRRKQEGAPVRDRAKSAAERARETLPYIGNLPRCRTCTTFFLPRSAHT